MKKAIVVNPTDPGVYYGALGDPRSFEDVDVKKLMKGDFAFLVMGDSAGATYYLRPEDGKSPECIFDGHEVLGAQLHLGGRLMGRDRCIARAKSQIVSTAREAGLEVDIRQGRDIDGIQDTFYVFV